MNGDGTHTAHWAGRYPIASYFSLDGIFCKIMDNIRIFFTDHIQVSLKYYAFRFF